MEGSEIETIILRFRDLVTSPGQTIDLHYQLCEAKGYVWWGWWNKAGEKIPDNEFRYLQSKAVREGLSIYLMDSGSLNIYKALCREMHWDPNHERINAPELDATPEYYRKMEYFVWFKLANIDINPLEEGILHNYSYMRVDDFFEDKPSRYDPFYNKRIHSPKEMRQQDRSIWFVRPYRNNDPIHEISLLDSKRLDPCDFNTEYIQTTSYNLLWVSDPHYSEEHHNFPLKANGVSSDLGLSIEKTLTDNGLKNIGGMIVTGDITWKADPEEFEYAFNLFNWVQSWGKLKRYQCAVCPGNHDLAYSQTPFEKNAEITVMRDEAKKPYEQFYQDLFYIKPNRYLCSGRRILLGNTIPVEIVCLNSSLLEQHEGLFQGHGFIGDEQLRKVSSQFNWSDQCEDNEPIPFRIVILHHHLIPVIFRESPCIDATYSIVLDAEALTQWIVKNKIQLVLHGHMHQPFYAKMSRPMTTQNNDDKWHEFYVLGLGSSGVDHSHLGEIGCNTFGVLNFAGKYINYHLYSIHPSGQSRHLETVKILYQR